MRKRFVVGLTLVLGIVLFGSPSHAELRGGQPFSESAKSLRAAANAAQADLQADVVVLLDEAHFVVRNKMVTKTVHHRIIKVQTEKGVENWGHFGRGWAPWYQERAQLDARVLDPSGTFHRLDPKTVEIVSQPQGEDHTYSDWRELRAPLAAVHPGSVIETLTTVTATRPYAKAGDRVQWYLGNSVPTLATRITVDSDRKLSPKLYLAPKAIQAVKRKGKNYSYSISQGRLEPYKYEAYQPYDKARLPLVVFSTGGTWKAVASEYAAIVNQQIARGALPKAALPKRRKNREATIASALATLHKRVRYTGLEFGQNAMVPWTPEESWTRQFGDCKDKATALVAMLRSVDIEAHVALLRSGQGQDVTQETPGMGGFNHAIVYVPAKGKSAPAYWIDATVELASLGQVGSSIQGRLALVAATSTKKLIKIPDAPANQNRIIEERIVTLPGYGKAAIQEVTKFFGTQELRARYSYRDRKQDKLRKDMEAYVADHYKAPVLTSVSTTAATDLSKPLQLVIKAKDADVTYAGTHEAGVYIGRAALFELISSELMVVANEKEHLRSRIEKRTKPLRVFPSHKEWRYRIEHPPGFEAKTLPRDQDRPLGALRFQQAFRVKKGYVEATFSISVDKHVLSAAEVNLTRKKIAALLDGDTLLVRLHHDAMSLWERGKVKEAFAVLRATRALKQSAADRADEDGRMAQLLLNVGLNKDALEVGKQALAVTPDSSLLSELMAISLEHSSFGRHLQDDFLHTEAGAAFEHAIATSPDNTGLRGRQGKLLLRNARGREFQGDMNLAIPHLHSAMKAGSEGYSWLYVRAMARAGRFETLFSESQDVEESADFAVGRIVSTFHVAGKEAMLKTAKERDVSEAVLRFSIYVLLDNRDYEPAKELMALLPTSEASEAWWKAAKELRRHESVRRPNQTKALIASALRDLDAGIEPREDATRESVSTAKWKLLRVALENARSQLPEMLRDNPAVVADYIFSQLEVLEEESGGSFRRVRFGIGPKDWAKTIFLAKRGRITQLLATNWYTQPLVAAAQQSLARKKSAEVTKVIEWLKFGEAEASSELFSKTMVWDRIAASVANEPLKSRLRWMLAAGANHQRIDQETTKALDECSRAGHRHCYEGFMSHLRSNREYVKALEVCTQMESLSLSAAEKSALLIERLGIMVRARQGKAALALAEEINETKGLTNLQRGLLYQHWGEVLSGEGKYAEGAELIREGLAAGYQTSANNLAWQELFVSGHPNIDEAIAHARSERPDDGALHTLAALLAANGDYVEAMETIARAQQVRGSVLAIDWLVYGRVAADLGFVQSARKAYERVYSDNDARDNDSRVSTAQLARRWSEELAVR